MDSFLPIAFIAIAGIVVLALSVTELVAATRLRADRRTAEQDLRHELGGGSAVSSTATWIVASAVVCGAIWLARGRPDGLSWLVMAVVLFGLAAGLAAKAVVRRSPTAMAPQAWAVGGLLVAMGGVTMALGG